MNRILRTLLVEDEAADARLVVHALKSGGYQVEWKRVETAEQMRQALRCAEWDVVVADFRLPHFSGVEALALLKECSPDTPLILVSGTVTEELAVDALRAGARDFVVKDRLARLVPAVQRERAEAEQRREKRGLEARLKSEQDRFRALVEQSSEAILVIDPNGRVVYESPSAERIFGFPVEERIGRSIFEHINDEDAKLLASDLSAMVETPGSTRLRSFRFRRKDGAWRWLEGAATNLIDDPSIGGFVANVRDITDRRQAERALEEYRQRLQAILDHSPALIFMKDRAGRYILTNQLFNRKFLPDGRSPLGLTVFDLFPKTIAESRSRHDTAVYDTGKPIVCEEFSEEEDGRHTYLSVKFPLRDAAGYVYGMGGIGTDITEKKSLETQYLHAQKMEEFGKLAGGVAHDFNNLLTAILIHVSLLQAPETDAAEIAEGLKQIGEVGQRAAALTRQLLVFSRRQVAQKRSVDLCELVAELTKMLRRLLGENIVLTLRLPEHPVWLDADPGMVEQAVMNLCVNARDAMPEGGAIDVEVAVRAPGEHPDDTLFGGTRWACLSVRDSGCGMDQATIQRIFEPFFTTKEAGKGTGLGLTIVDTVAKQHGGRVEVDSNPGHGTVFRLLFPALAGPVIAERVSAEVPRGGQESILLVEDECSVRRPTAAVLRKSGYTVVEAADGREALKAWEEREGRFDLLFADVVIPGPMTGLALCDELRKENPALSVVLCSGYSIETARIEATVGAGVVFLGKPFGTSKMLVAIREALESRPRPVPVIGR